MIEFDAVAAQLFDDVEYFVGSVNKRFKLRNLTADVHVDARDADTGKRFGVFVELDRLIEGNAEFIVLEAC